MTEQEKLDQLKRAVLLALDMRARQKAYFNHRTQGNLIEAKQAEAAFDKIGHQALHQALQLLPGQGELSALHKPVFGAEIKSCDALPKLILDEAGPVSDAVWEGMNPNEPTTHG